jgi:hypothetical protein
VIFSVLIIGAFFLGRWTAGNDDTVQAAPERITAPVEVDMSSASVDEIDEPSALTGDPVMGEAPAVEPMSEPASMSLMEQHTRDFMSTENMVTLRVIYYGDDEQGQRRAYQTALHLEDMGFPVVNPIVKGDYVYVCVGAAPSKNDQELMRYQRELQLVPGPKPYGKPGDYASAFPYNIDKLITR